MYEVIICVVLNIISFFLFPILIAYCEKKDIMSYPNEDRWSRKPTCNIGGIIICIPLFWFSIQVSWWMFTSIVILFFYGIGDDLFKYRSALPKFVTQVIAVYLFLYFVDIRFHWFECIEIDKIVTGIWLVGFINAYNMIDNIDGMASSIGLLSCLFLSIAVPEYKYLLGFLIPTLCAFLIYNYPPAKVFMGDCGSLTIGFVLAVSVVKFFDNSRTGFVIYPFFIVWFPLVDMVYVVIKRSMRRRWFWIGGKDHLAHMYSSSYKYGGEERTLFFFTYVHFAFCILGSELIRRLI